MNTLLNRIFQHPLQSLLKLACATAVLAGCGGGGGSSGTTSFAYGPISGFGSIIVNGVRFDDSSSSVSSEDDDDSTTPHSSSDLKLGMVVAVQGGSITSDSSGHHSRAGEIRFGSEIVGPVSRATIKVNVDARSGSFVLLGQTVNVSASTVIDDSLIAAVTAGTDPIVVEVHGTLDSTTGAYNATRIELKASATQFKIRGAVASLDPAAHTFKIGSELISYPADLKLPNGFAEKLIVRVKVQTVQVAGAWVATRIKSGVNSMGDHGEAEAKGTVTDFKSKSDFKVNGISVDATNATIYPSSLDKGAFVEVEGAMVNGTLVAKKVALEDSLSEGNGDFEFHGRIANLNADHTGFDVHSQAVKITDATVFARGATKANLAKDMCVEVKTDAAMNATFVKADNDCAP
jgi:Domain of unknown function (DUF5666)